MPLQATSGAASYDGFGGGVAAVPNYIEECFSTTLYTGNGSTQTIANGIDLSGKGGLVWIKARNAAEGHRLLNTINGPTKILQSNSTVVEDTIDGGFNNFLSNGFSLKADNGWRINASGDTYASWTFRKQPKFFDVVTWTGDGIAGRQISHSLGSAPGCIIIKCTTVGYGWVVGHRGAGWSNSAALQSTDPFGPNATTFNSTDPTSTVFTVGDAGGVNQSGQTYVAYIYAHNAGGFGLTGTDNVISCGSFTTDGSGNATVNLGYEPQWVLVKSSVNATSWIILDTMRGWNESSNDRGLAPNSSGAESTFSGQYGTPTATGFTVASNFGTSDTNIYIAIRRGPMKVPTVGTKVFTPIARAGTGTDTSITGVGFAPDVVVSKNRGVGPPTWWDKLRGAYPWLKSSDIGAEGTTTTNALLSYTNDGVNVGTDGNQLNINYSGFNYITYFLRRAPSFHDEVCYTGTGSITTVTHNLGVAPELMLVKRRDAGASWVVYSSGIAVTDILTLQSTNAAGANTAVFNSTAPTSSVFTVGTSTTSNGSGGTYVAYLFATCAGVSKVGSYTGTGTTLQVNCGFTGGARFVMVKATSTTGNWVVVDTARGMVAGTDPYLNLNTTAAEVNANNIYTTTGGFQLVSSDANTNANGTSYIFLAVA